MANQSSRLRAEMDGTDGEKILFFCKRVDGCLIRAPISRFPTEAMRVTHQNRVRAHLLCRTSGPPLCTLSARP
jgi:hypothetical protein